MFDHVVDVPRPVPISMKIAAPGKQENGAPAPFERFGAIGQIAKGCPGKPTWIRHRKNSGVPIDGCRFAFVSERQNPRISSDKVSTVTSIEAHLASGLVRVVRTEKNNEVVAGEARWIDLDPRCTGQVQIGDAEFEVRCCHGLVVAQIPPTDTP